MRFWQFALNNVRRNAHAYSAYFLSSSFAVMIFFTYAVFIFHPDITKSRLGESVRIGMTAAEFVIFGFSFLFVLFSISAFLKARKNDFGILIILGASGKQLNYLIFLENMLIGSASIAVGIGSGMIFSKLFLLIGTRVMEIKKLPMYLPWEAIKLTIGAFFALFFIISWFTVLFIRQNQVLEFLQGAKKLQSEPKVSPFLSIVSIVAFTGSIYLFQHPTNNIIPLILLLNMIGTYFFFSQLIVLAILLLKKNRWLFWRGTNLLWISDMAYKMKDNARMLSMVTIITTMACTSIGLVLMIDQLNKQIYQDTPYDLKFRILEEKEGLADIQTIDRELQLAGVKKYQKVDIHLSYFDFKEILRPLAVIKQSDFRKLEKEFDLKMVPIHSNEGIYLVNPIQWNQEQLKYLNQFTLDKKDVTLQIVEQFKKAVIGLSENVLVVSDSTYHQLKPFRSGNEEKWIYYFIPEWPNHIIPYSNSPQVKVSEQLIKWNRDRLDKNAGGLLLSRTDEYIELKRSMRIMIFIGLFIAAIFTLSMASFLYFKLYTDLDRERRHYLMVSKLGLSVEEIMRSSSIQIAILFFTPLIVAALQTGYALAEMKVMFHLLTYISISRPVMIAIGGFFLAQLIYFWIVRSRYLAHLKRAML
ncbi:ABC transporter permease [Thermoflavimicrobium daqui]|jgi:putative ABC transport system permease protein|nr:ABC transporter permease [Thermoflavimicrobium daqui]